MKTVYYADHNNIKESELITVREEIDLLENISYAVVLDQPYTKNGDRVEYVIGLFNNIDEAISLANNYQTI